MLGLALMMDTPALVTGRLPQVQDAAHPHDPILMEDPVVHGFLHVSLNFLNLWALRDFGASLPNCIRLTVGSKAENDRLLTLFADMDKEKS